MLIKYKDLYVALDEIKTQTVETFISETLYDDANQYHGIQESTAAHANETGRALGRLTELLASKGLLDAEEVQYVSGCYSVHDVELIKEPNDDDE